MKRQREFTVFDQIEIDNVSKNTFDESFGNNLTLDMGKLYPVMCLETIPNSHYKIRLNMLIRYMAMLSPCFQNMKATVHLFYVPKRVCWENFPQHIAGEEYALPYFQHTDDVNNKWPIANGSIFDYFGLPECDKMEEKIDATPFMAFMRIYNEYFQDQNNDDTYKLLRDKLKALQRENGLITADELKVAGSTKTDYNEVLNLLQRAWEHDIFTSALPTAQKGSPVNIPLSLGDIPVTITHAKKLDGTDLPEDAPLAAIGANPQNGQIYQDGTVDTDAILIGTADGAEAELVGTIAELRTAEAVQKLLELMARSGTRYNEFIEAVFQGNIGDARINRPEYLGKVVSDVHVSEVLQTSATTDDGPLGDMGGHGATVANNSFRDFYSTEHGWIIGLLSVLPTTSYFQGISKKFQRLNQLDNYFPQTAHVGEMAIKNKELYYDPTLTDNDEDFGYISRDAHYKYNPSETHGDFRSSLLHWSLVRKFDERPVLNSEFVYANPSKRIFAVQDDEVHSLLARLWFDIKSSKPIPFFSTPGLTQ